MIPRILNGNTDILTVDYLNYHQYDALTDIIDGSYSREELHTGVLTVFLEYPCDGLNADKLVGDSYILYKINGYEEPHLFIINQVEKDSDGLIYEVYGHSVTYMADLDYTSYFELGKSTTSIDFVNKLNTVGDLNVITVETAMLGVLANGFKETTLRNKLDLINSDSKDSFISMFGGYLKRFKNTIKLLDRRGTDRKEILRYGENIEEVSYNADYDNVITAVKFLCLDGETLLTSTIVFSPKNITNDLRHLKVISISKYELQREFGFDINIQALLQTKADVFFSSAENIDIDEPNINLTLKIDEKRSVFGKLFENAYVFEFKLGDRVKLLVDKMNIDLISEVSSIDFDGVKEEIKELKFGKVKRYLTTVYKEDYEDPNSSNNNNLGYNSSDWGGKLSDLLFPTTNDMVDPVEEDTTPEVIMNGGNPLFEIDNRNLIIEDGESWTTPIITPTIYNTEDNQIYIARVSWRLGDLYGPKPSHENANGEIIDGSRLKYFRYKNGQISFKLNKWLADCYASGLNETQNNWDEYDYHTHPTFSLDLFVNSTKSSTGYVYQGVSITIQGGLTDTTPLISSPLHPFEYMNYIKTTEKGDKLSFYLASRLFIAQAIITNEVNLETLFNWTTMSNFNIKVSQKLFDKVLELLLKFHEDETPDIVIREFTDAEYIEYRDAFVTSRLS